MNTNLRTTLTHIAGTFLIHAPGACLNAGAMGDGDNPNVAVPKTFSDGRDQVPYVSAQAWRRWLRSTAIQEANWPASELQAIGWNSKGNVNKVAGRLNPVEFPEDDIFGYMRAQAGHDRRKVAGENEGEEGELGIKTSAVMRASPFATSLLVSLRSTGWRGEDAGFVHLTKYDPEALAEAQVERFLNSVSEGGKEGKQDVWTRLESFGTEWATEVRSAAAAPNVEKLRELLLAKGSDKDGELNLIANATSPLPYATRFYNTHLQGVFCLDYSRLGVFWNLGDRIELEESQARKFLEAKVIEDISDEQEYRALTQNGKAGRVYRMVDIDRIRKLRTSVLLKALAVLRGGANQAQFGTDIAPKVLLLAGLTCGNPIFNHLFEDSDHGPKLKIEPFKEILRDYANRIVTPVLIGIRSGYLGNESDVRALSGFWKLQQGAERSGAASLEGPSSTPVEGTSIELRVRTPIEAAREIEEQLP
jgi:CRISPR-associated autoregulator DevR family